MSDRRNWSNESGAALPAVLFVSALLLVGSAFLLDSVGKQSLNSTDVLSETKAYYAAESGLQATINVLRFNDVDYGEANASGNLATGGAITTGLSYNADGVVPVGADSSFRVEVWDPDNSSVSTTFNTDGQFQGSDGLWYSTRVFGDGTNATTISYTPAPSTPHNHPINGAPLGSFVITNTAGAGAAVTQHRFRIAYRMTAPRSATRYLAGYIRTGPLRVDFDDATYNLMGGEIDICSDSTCTSPGNDGWEPTLSVGTPVPVYGRIDPLKPFRLAVRSTGFSSLNARKTLEAVLQNNFFNDLGSSAAISMLGPNAIFNSGNSNNMQIMGGSVPSVGVSDPTGLAEVLNDARADDAHMFPPPVVFGDDLPEWQQSAANMDAFVQQLKQAAINSGRYYPNGQTPPNWGDFDSGTGITFCDGNCDMGNANGGGILVVTGGFSASGNASFKGLVLVTGSAGVTRSGGGSHNGNFIGSIVVAPYDPNNLAGGFTQPRYEQNGGSDGSYSDTALVDTFNGTRAISNFVLGIAEK